MEGMISLELKIEVEEVAGGIATYRNDFGQWAIERRTTRNIGHF